MAKTASIAEKGAPHRKNVARGGQGRQEERARASRSRPRASKLMPFDSKSDPTRPKVDSKTVLDENLRIVLPHTREHVF